MRRVKLVETIKACIGISVLIFVSGITFCFCKFWNEWVDNRFWEDDKDGND
jgi:hypothetical protein